MSPDQQTSYKPSFDSDGISRSSTLSTANSSSGHSITSSAFKELLKRNPQQVSARYLKEDKLKRYLRSKFRPEEWEVHRILSME
ncbi:hypothetical protein LTR84_007310 [Exophiala bonariae]|uniref:Clr5 domain-containing protein n=1 Tax=Exophiala bonariae TaxID=1690606 RepID=A0AAV9N1A3_9EURO|nr:hypothetical protein LTR84_007310 [Exophiala bonariae]